MAFIYYVQEWLKNQEQKIKSCPFCKNRDIEFQVQNGDFNIGYISYIKCKECGATQGWIYGDTIYRAALNCIKKWNQRKIW